LRGLATIAETYGTGEVRLTVWQNLLIPHIESHYLAAVCQSILDLGLDFKASSFRAGLVACTGSAGCKYAGADTKANAMELSAFLESKFQIDQAINIHITGCHHSCAQHAIGDIGLLATKVEVASTDADADEDDTEMVDGYHILLGGRTGGDPMIGVKVFDSVSWSECPSRVAMIIEHYLRNRKLYESFEAFSRREDWLAFASPMQGEVALARVNS
jgi:ferredoxin-nitrite reductase